LFAEFGIPPTKTRWRPIAVEITDITVSNQAISEKTFVNNMETPVTYHAQISYGATNSTESGWNLSNT
jgi:hypothetical protein